MPKFEAILPLTDVQESLLLHRQLSAVDQGELHVEFSLEGEIDRERAQTAWNTLVDIHPVLRTTIHTEKVKTPVQIVHPTRSQEIVWHDYVSDKQIQEAKEQDRKEGYALAKYPSAPWQIYSHADGKNHRVLWYCHHMLLDGWSTANLLKDWLDLYHGKEILLPPTMQQYVRWLKDQSSLNIEEKREHFLSTQKNCIPAQEKNYPAQSLSGSISPRTTNGITQFCAEHNLTQNTFFMGSWALTLHQWFGEQKLSFATTLSGRQIDFPKVTSLAGLLSNIAPVFSDYTENISTASWLAEFQLRSVHTTSLQYVAFHKLQEFWRNAGIEYHVDSLFTFENFPWRDLLESELSISQFSSGVTANFPISITVIPGETARFQLDIQEGFYSEVEVQELFDLYNQSIRDLLSEQNLNIHLVSKKENQKAKEWGLEDLPINTTESKWIEIWNKVLGISQISTQDNFFSLGGKSIHAIQIFAEWEKATGQNLPPALLLENPSVKQLAKLSESENDITWSSVVPLQLSGTSDPLFCIHAGGAHVFVYRELADHLKENRPVYAIQPYGLDGQSDHNSSIEQMAEAYWDEIVKIQASGPIIVLGYCFSAAIVAEMAQIAQDASRDIHIIVVDSAPGLTYGREKLPLAGRISKLWKMIHSGQSARIKEVIEGKWDNFKANFLSHWESEQMKNFRKVEAQLSKVYQKYHWQDSRQTIHLIRSSEFAGRSDKDIHVEEWNRLVGNNLKTYIVDGSHKTLFESPTVSILAHTIESTLDTSR